MKRYKRTNVGPLAMWTSGAILIGLCLLQPQAVRAQWTTPDGNGNINNTNTGNVGVGTSGPNYKFDITNALDRAQVRFGMGGGDSGGFLYSGGPSHAVFSAGAAYNSGWVAKSMSASMIEANLGQLTFYTNPGLSTGSPFAPTARMVVTSGGLVGIGTTSPSGLLTLRVPAGDVIQSFTNAGGSGGELNIRYKYESALHRMGFTDSFGNWLFYSQYASQNTNSIGYFPGKVGIGISAPVYSLDVAGGVNGFRAKATTVSSSDAIAAFENTNGIQLMVRGNGFVGIGTTTPSYKLHVQGGSINASDGICINGDCKTAWSQVGGGASQWTTAAPHIYYNGGNVGIGTSTPTQKLEVNGSALIGTIFGSSAASGVLSLQSTSSTTKGTINIGVDQTTTTSIGQSGTPGNKLLVASDRLIVNNAGVRVNGAADHGDLSVTKLNLVNADALQFRTTNPNITSNGSMLFTVNNINGDNVRFNVQNSTISNAFVIDTNGSTPSRLLDVRNLGNSRFMVSGAGNVGIGTTTPTKALDVVGDVNASGTITGGNIKAKYQDVAEWVESSQQLEAGTVVVLDSNQVNQVVASTQAYDSSVAGVISLRPGLALGEEGEGRVLVATTGRVKIKVDATNGPIKIGDLLVTSDREGFAMKSVPVDVGGVRMHRPGTLIGKALEPLAQGTGEILVLLSMQ